MDDEGGLDIISPDAIVSNKDLFRNMIVVCLNRHHKHTFDAIRSNDWKDWRALRASIGIINSFVAPYFDDVYNAEVAALKERLIVSKDLFSKDEDYIRAMEEWLEKIIKKFSSPSIAILPPREVTFWMGRGELKDEYFTQRIAKTH